VLAGEAKCRKRRDSSSQRLVVQMAALTRVINGSVIRRGKRVLFLETESAGSSLCQWESSVGCKQEEVKQRAVGRFGRACFKF
jgi:hypothetical protein